MYVSPYDTFACRPLAKVVEKTTAAIISDNVRGNLLSNKGGSNLLYGSRTKLPEGVRLFLSYDKVDQLFHPLPISSAESGAGNANFVVIDARPIAKESAIAQGSFIPKNEDNFKFNVIVAGLTHLLQQNDKGGFDALIAPTTRVFANWLRTAITRKFKVPDHLHETVEAIAAAYCYFMFRGNVTKLTDEAREIWALRLQREFRFRSIDTAKEVCEKITEMKGIVDLVDNIKKICDTPSLDGLTPLTLLQSIYTGWDSATGNYTLSVAMEHLPTLIAVIYISQHLTYARMPLSKTVKLLLDRNHADYVSRVDRLLI